MAAVGDEIRNRYVLRERLGVGGMGAVWLADDAILHRQVALKSPQPGNRRAVARLKTEARNAARLHHPNLVAVYDFFEEATVSWLVMEYVSGPSLARVLSDTGPMRPAEAAKLGGQIAEALAHAHGRGIAHRDVTPENILLTDKKVAKLGDFGISKDLHGAPTLTDGSSTSLGKPAYLAPEMSRGQPADCASDMFSLGATIYAAVTGHPPSADGADAASTTPAATGAAGSLHAVLRRLMATDPRRRPSAAEAANLFARVNQPGRDQVARAGWPTRHGAPGWSAHPGRAMLAVAVTVLVLLTMAASAPPRQSDRAARTPPVVIGDARTADPCALLSPNALARFGNARIFTDYGNFDRCDVFVRRGDTVVGGVKLTLQKGTREPDAYLTTHKVGAVTVLAEPASSDSCERNLAFADGNRVNITGRVETPDGPDPCALADATASYAASVANKPPIPRRPGSPPARSLVSADACGLLGGTALAALPGVDALHPVPGYGNWSCRWNSTITGSAWLAFDRNRRLGATDGRPVVLNGRQSFLTEGLDGPNDCTIRAEHRHYLNLGGEPSTELVLLQVMGARPMNQLCDTATTLMTAALQALAKQFPV